MFGVGPPKISFFLVERVLETGVLQHMSSGEQSRNLEAVAAAIIYFNW